MCEIHGYFYLYEYNNYIDESTKQYRRRNIMSEYRTKWTGRYPVLCHGTWLLYKDGKNVSTLIPEDLQDEPMGCAGWFQEWSFVNGWETECHRTMTVLAPTSGSKKTGIGSKTLDRKRTTKRYLKLSRKTTGEAAAVEGVYNEHFCSLT